MLRKAGKSGNTVGWTDEELIAGFKKFYDEHGHYPNAYEVDEYEYLPTSRSIQRSFGGLVALRKRLFPESIANYTSGEYRKSIASGMYLRSRQYEERFWLKLCSIFQEISIHEQKRVRPGEVSADFFIYTQPSLGISVDTFFAKDYKSVANIVNIKLKRYRLLVCEV